MQVDVLKSSIFVVLKLALHQNGVEFRQQSIGDIRSSVATLYDAVRWYQSFWSTYSPTYSQSHVWRQARCLEKGVNINKLANKETFVICQLPCHR